MTPDEIRALLLAAFPDADEIQVQGGGGKFTATVVTDRFEGLRRLPREQMLNAPVMAALASGAIHAISWNPLTREEWRKAKLFG